MSILVFFLGGMKGVIADALRKKREKCPFPKKFRKLILPYTKKFFFIDIGYSAVYCNGKIELHLYSDSELSRKIGE